MSELETHRFIQAPLTIEAFQFTGGVENAKAIVERLMVTGGEATWRPAWVSFERGNTIENPETLEIEKRMFMTVGDWILLKPNILKARGLEIKIIDDTRFKDQYIHENATQARETHTENTLEKVYNTLGKYTGNEERSRDLVTDLQNAGILFRERI